MQGQMYAEHSAQEYPHLQTRQQRRAFFEQAEAHPHSVPYGCALAQASIGGDEDQLYRDCARIMAHELRRSALEQGRPHPDIPVLDGYVRHSPVFLEAYWAARRNTPGWTERPQDLLEVLARRIPVERTSELYAG